MNCLSIVDGSVTSEGMSSLSSQIQLDRNIRIPFTIIIYYTGSLPSNIYVCADGRTISPVTILEAAAHDYAWHSDSANECVAHDRFVHVL